MTNEGRDKKENPRNTSGVPEDADLKNKILQGMGKSFTGEETMRWLSVLDKDPLSAEETIAPGQLIQEAQLPMTGVLDILFDHLQRYTFEFNKNPIAERFKVQCERPKGLHELADFSRFSRRVKYAQGHLSTREWSLIIQGIDDEIEVFVLPGDFLIGFRPGQTQFQPFLSMSLTQMKGRSAWTILDKPLARDSMPKLARRLFGQLIKVAKGESSESEKFKFSTRDSQEVSSQSFERSYEKDDHPSLWLLGPEPADQPRPKSVDPGTGACGEKRAETAVETLAASKPDMSLENVRATCKEFVAEIDRQVESMQQMGMRAMKDDNMAGVTEAMKRSQMLKGLKEKVVGFMEEWD